jgi:hypothetical protein
MVGENAGLLHVFSIRHACGGCKDELRVAREAAETSRKGGRSCASCARGIRTSLYSTKTAKVRLKNPRYSLRLCGKNII